MLFTTGLNTSDWQKAKDVVNNSANTGIIIYGLQHI